MIGPPGVRAAARSIALRSGPREPIQPIYVQGNILAPGHRAPTQEAPMPYPPDHRRLTRARIIRSAQALFNRHGFTSVSIDDLMEAAGLTRGGFYSYFRAKSELYAEAVPLAPAATPWSRWDGVSGDFAARDAARPVIDAHLLR